ncbi:hypothetical protein QCA50_008420 [Cerrena zonata]|uniref:FAD dependent oxidoreductase domain-containing protein n=1 Tax=Cerrena zonata TaxID=2478898 RepID=A0AAW0G3I3_9APHY
MGSQISRLKVLVGISYYLNKHLDDVNKRLEQSPGIPVPNPSLAFWAVPKAEILGDGELPETVDIVVIGSGITGTSFAYNLFKNEQSLKVLMLEARDVCSGATGRHVIFILTLCIRH